MIDRRGFLSLLGLGGVGLVVARAVPAPLEVLLPAEPLVVDASATYMNPSWIMKEIAMAFTKQLGDYKTKYVPCPEGARLGDVISGHRMVSQRFHGSEWDWVKAPKATHKEDDMIERVRASHCRPLGMMLAEAVKANNIRVLSDLSMPLGGARATRIASQHSGYSLRGVWQYDVARDRELFRVDLIGAAA